MNVKFSTKFVAASAAAVMALSLAGCSGGSMDDSSSSSAKASGDSITIGTVTTNSGTAAAYGEAEVKGFELAVSEINAKGGINGKKVKLESMDDKGDATEASNAYNKLAGDNNVLAVAGPTISATTAAVAPLADQSKLVTIAPAATSDSIETGNYLFRTCFKDSYQGEVAARFAAENLKVKKVAVLYGTGDPYSSGVGEAFAKAAEKLGLEVVDKESSSSSADDTEYSAQLQKIQASGAELLYAPYYYSVAGPYIIPQARSVGFEGYVMGPDGYDGLKLTGDKSQYNKTYYTTHYSADDNTNTKVQDFIKSYKSKNNAEPNTFAALGYDTIYMIKQAIEKAGENATREDVRNAVAGMTFDGVTGKFTMDKSGSPTKSVTVLEMKDGKPVYNTTVQPK